MNEAEEEGEEDRGSDVSGAEEDEGVEAAVLAEEKAAVAGDDSGKMEEIPLKGDGWELAGGGDDARVSGISDNEEVDDFDGDCGDEGELEAREREHKHPLAEGDGRRAEKVGSPPGASGAPKGLSPF
jgi:hypothetical protein